MPDPSQSRSRRATHRIAIVGLSWIGADPPAAASDRSLGSAMPGSHAAAIAEIGELDLVGVCDVAAEARASFLVRWEGRWPDVRAYESYDELLRKVRPEIVSIVTPDDLHGPVFHAAINAGARGIFCEKPLAVDLHEADRMVSAAAAAGVATNVNYTRRWLPEFVEARRMLRAGECGPLSHVVIQRGGPRAMLWRNHSHLIDLICYFAESEPDWVSAETEPGWSPEALAYTGGGGGDAANEPGVNAYLAFHNGTRAFLAGMKSGTGEIVVDLVGADGRITVDANGSRLVTVPRDDWRLPPSESDRGIRTRRVEPRFRVGGMEAALRELIDAIATGEATTSTAGSARMTVAITDAILRSAAAGGIRTAVEQPPSR